MKNNTFFKVLNFVMFVLAVAFGGGAMAMADLVEPQIGNEGGDVLDGTNHTDTDPADATTSDIPAPGDTKMGQALEGTQMSSTQQRKAGNVDDEWDSEIVKFHPYRNPLLSIARQVSRKINVQNWVIKHGRVGGETLDGIWTPGALTTPATITFSTSNFTGSLKPFYKGSTVLFPAVKGYKNGDSSKPDGCLEAFVTNVASGTVTLRPINGLTASGSTYTGELEDMTFPSFAASTSYKVLASASAGSESQLMISPENYQPRDVEIYVQKKLLNIVFTEDFAKIKKKQPHKFEDVRANAIYLYNMRAERNYWMGNKSRFSVQNNDGSVEDVYTSDGILKQVTNSYAIGDEYTLADLIAISKLQFTDFSEHDDAYVFCGKNAMAKLLNVNPGTNRHIEFGNVNMYNIDFKQLKTTFGTLNFCWCQALDFMDMKDVMVVLDLAGATRYVKIGEKEQTNDMSKGAGEIRDAKRFIHYEADAIALRGYNSVIVGPTSYILGLPTSQYRSQVVSSATLPASPAKDTIVALTADYELSGVTYEAGKVYTYNGTSWSEWTGTTSAA